MTVAATTVSNILASEWTTLGVAEDMFNIQVPLNASPIIIKATATATKPTSTVGGIEVLPGQPYYRVTIADLWRGSTDTYLHCIAVLGASAVNFSAD